MSLLDTASLIVTPNGYKADKLYSVKPTDASGDMTVVRATSATRVNSAGLIEIASTNLVLQSQTFDNIYWTKQELTLTANSIISPDGTLNAYKLTPTTVSSPHQLNKLSISTSVSNTMSFYAKKGGYDLIECLDGASGFNGSKFNLNTGTFTNQGTGVGSMNFVGDGWYRCVVTVVTTGIRLYINNSSSYIGDGTSGIYLWGVQYETGTTATDYIPTTTSIRTKFAGITQDGSSASNIPRLDYPPLGGCPSILVEPQRTNNVLYSEQFDNASWSKSFVTATANTTTSPDGTTTADTITGIGALGARLIQTNSISFTASTSYSLSVFAKKGTNDFIQLFVPLGIGGMFANFNLNTGVVGTLGTTTGTAPTSSITNFGGGWYRCTMNFTATTTASTVPSISIVTSASAARAESNTLTTSVLLWGAQIEAGSNATSYIPTVAATVTRNADVISKTGISSLIGQTEGTLYAKVNVTNWTNLSRIFSISDGTSTNRIMILFNTSNRFRVIMDNLGGAAQADISSSSLSNGIHKIAVGYKANDFVFYVDGVLIGSDSSATIPACSSVYLGKIETSASSNFLDERIESATLFPTRLTNAQLATLTTI